MLNEKKSALAALRSMVLANESACVMVFRHANGETAAIETILGSPIKMAMIMRAVTHVTAFELERVISEQVGAGKTTPKVTWGDIERVKLAWHANQNQNRNPVNA